MSWKASLLMAFLQLRALLTMPLGISGRKVSPVETFLTAYKSPIGHLRLAQVLLSISCIALISCWGTTVHYTCRSEDGLTQHEHNLNTFRLSDVKLLGCDGQERTLWHANDDSINNGRFFYFVTGLGLLYSLVTSLGYTFLWTTYIANEPYVMLDLLLSFLMALLFLIAACVWWGGASVIGTATSDWNMQQLLSENAGFWDLQPEGHTFLRDSNVWVLPLSVVASWLLTIAHFASFFYVARCLFRKLSFEYDETGLGL